IRGADRLSRRCAPPLEIVRTQLRPRGDLVPDRRDEARDRVRSEGENPDRRRLSRDSHAGRNDQTGSLPPVDDVLGSGPAALAVGEGEGMADEDEWAVRQGEPPTGRGAAVLAFGHRDLAME